MKKLEVITNNGRSIFLIEGKEVKTNWSNVCGDIIMLYDYNEKAFFIYDVNKDSLKTIEQILWIEDYEKGVRLIAPKQEMFLSYDGKEIIPFSLGANSIFPRKKVIEISRKMNGYSIYGVYTYEGKEWISVNKKAIRIYDDHIEVLDFLF